MRTFNYLAASLLAVLTVAVSCEKGPLPFVQDKGVVKLEVIADRPAPVDDETRVTLADGQLAWEGDETVGVLFSASQDTAGGPRAVLNSVSEGRFKGEIDLDQFNFKGRTMSDLKAIVLPANRNSRFECRSAGNRIATPVTAVQVQNEDGVLNGEYVPLFAAVSEKDLRQTEDGKYTLDGIQLRYGCTLAEYHVYGEHPDAMSTEVLESVTIQCTNKAITGIGYWSGSNYRTFSISGTISDPITVLLKEKCKIQGRTRDNGIKLYAALMPRYEGNATPKLKTITVTTDKAVYEKEVSVNLTLRAGHVIRMGLDLSTFTRTPAQATTKTYTIHSSGLTLKQGAVDSLYYYGYAPLSQRRITVYTYIPNGDVTKMPILFAMHGSGRNGKGTVNQWKTTADNKKVIVIAPTFYKDFYPNSYYQLGNVSWSTTSWNPKPHHVVTYNIIEELFALFKKTLGNTSESYDLWGHSAGSQFSHRFTLHMPEAHLNRIVCSNAGYYTVPEPNGICNGTTTFGYPNSILGTDIDNEQLRIYFSRHLTVHAGTADTATTLEEDDQLPVGPGPSTQGACRYERAQFFYKRAKAVADSLGMPFNWQYVEVAGVAHNATKMVQDTKTGAALLLYGK